MKLKRPRDWRRRVSLQTTIHRGPHFSAAYGGISAQRPNRGCRLLTTKADMTPIKTPRKLIEVALPLDKINAAAAREKSIRHGHPSTLHLWWARRPLAVARAVIFAQMVNDPGYERHLRRGVNKEKAAIERERLFKIIEDLVLWENTNN
jgi:hypothetical protein